MTTTHTESQTTNIPRTPGTNTEILGSVPPKNPYDSLTTPIVRAATYTFRNTEELIRYQRQALEGHADRCEYGRYDNPTIQACEQALAKLDRAERAGFFPSGMAAITTTLSTLLTPGSHLIMGDDCYRRTRDYCTNILSHSGVGVSIIKMGDTAALIDAIRPETRAIFLEAPTNPYLRVVDLKELSSIARSRGILTIIDATFASPANQRPIDWGIDLVVHSVTKYISGLNTDLAGSVAGRSELVDPIIRRRGILGCISTPEVAFNTMQSIKTLGIRMDIHNTNAQAVAEFLENHPKISRVWYPGLRSHPDFAIAREQMKGFGGVVSFEVAGDFDDTGRFIDAVRIPRIAPSLGGVDSLIEQPKVMSYLGYPAADCLKWGIKDNLVRMAVGIEDEADLILDLKQALQKL